MLFGKKKSVSKEDLQLQVFQTKIELRRLLDKYESLLERELRVAQHEKDSGVARPSNYDRIKTIVGLMSTTQAAYQDMDNISTADELNRTTNELAQVLKTVNSISGSSQRANVGGLNQGLRNIQASEAKMNREYAAQNRVIARATGDAKGYDAQLQAILNEALGDAPQVESYSAPTGGTAAAQTVRPMTDAELEAEMDDINRHLYSVLEDV